MYDHQAFLADLASGHSTKCYFANGGVPRELTFNLMHEMEHAVRWHGSGPTEIRCAVTQVEAFESLIDACSGRTYQDAPFRGCAWNGIPIQPDRSVGPRQMVWYSGDVVVGVIDDLQVISVNRIKVQADDPDRFVSELKAAFPVGALGGLPGGLVYNDCKISRSDVDAMMTDLRANPPPPLQVVVLDPPVLIDGLTPGECRDRWEANAAAIESGMAMPYALSPNQRTEGKRLHLSALKAGR